MDWDMAQLITAIAAWIGAGFCAGGLSFASKQKGYAFSAADDYNHDVLRCFWLGVVGGLVTLILAGLNLMFGSWEYHGMLFPGRSSWSRTDAKALQRRAIRGGDTTID
mgnify:CR=1 FL=1